MVTVSARAKKALLAAGFVLGILLLGLLCFYKLGVGELCDWDEARHAVSAYEMIQTGEPIVTTYEYSNDYWNLKPPLSEWLIALGYKVFGCNTVGLRFYSAVSMFLAALAVAAFLRRRYGRVEAVFSLYAFMAVSTLFSYHAARHGDADALFILCYTLSLVCLCEGRRDFRWVYGACLAFSFAFLAKGFHAGTIAVTVLLMLLLLGYFPRMKFRRYALCALCSLGPAGCWALARLWKDGPKFLISMFTYDVVARATGNPEGHAALPIHFFGVILHTNSLLYLLAIGLLILFGGWYWLRHEGTSRPAFLDSDLFLSVLAVAVPFLIFSAAKTKIDWYILPLYPALVLWASISLHYVLQNKSLRFGTALAALAFVVCIGVSVKNVKEIAFDVTSSPSAVSQLLTPVGSLDKAHTYITNDVGSSWDGSGWNGTEWRQVQLTEAEWLTDCTPRQGGIAAFEKDPGSYLIVVNSRLKELAQYPVVAQTEHYSLLSNS